MSHTPGPWQVIKEEGFGDWVVRAPVSGRYSNEIAGFACNEPYGEADARLIAAAPELYEACKIAEEAVRTAIPQEAVRLIHEQGDFDALCIARIRLEEAIAKAEGNE